MNPESVPHLPLMSREGGMEGQGYLGQVPCSSGTAMPCPVQPQPFTAHICRAEVSCRWHIPNSHQTEHLRDRKAWSSWGAALMLEPQKFRTTRQLRQSERPVWETWRVNGLENSGNEGWVVWEKKSMWRGVETTERATVSSLSSVLM